MNRQETFRSEAVEGENQPTDLERRLLDLSEYYLSARKLRYKDDITGTLESLYCLKECDERKADLDRGPLSFFRHPLASIGRLRARGKFYCGINGNYYRSSDFVTWAKAKPLLRTLREKIKSGEFDPDWSVDICP
jgi:hypothetical protein